jgi:hypothetical protein
MKPLKEQYNKLFKNAKTINEHTRLAGMVIQKPSSQKRLTKEDNPAAYNEGPELSNEDYTYFADQLDEFNQQAEELHQEIGSPIEMAAEESMYAPRYEMQEKQLSRYFQTIFKSIENCKKFLIKQGRISDS